MWFWSFTQLGLFVKARVTASLMSESCSGSPVLPVCGYAVVSVVEPPYVTVFEIVPF
jgi:hypothetical protein